MSFILEALKKLEQKRHQGTVPDLMTIHEAKRQRPARMIWPYAVAILMVNAIILAAVFRPWEAKEQMPAAQVSAEKHLETIPEPAKQQDVRSDKSKPAALQTKERIVVPEKKSIEKQPSKDSKTIIAKTEIKPRSQKREDPPALPEKPIKEPVQVQESPVNIQKPTEDTSATLRMNTSPQEMELLRKKIKEETSHLNPAPLVTKKSANNVEAESKKQILEFSQLPEETKKELSNITISGHIYSNSPRSRVVTINSSALKEGEEVKKGLTVREITMTGVVLDYQGLRFQMRAF